MRRQGRIIGLVLCEDYIYPKNENRHIGQVKTDGDHQQPSQGNTFRGIADQVPDVPLVTVDQDEGDGTVSSY